MIRKMQTAAGGPIRLKFTPEQVKYFESLLVPKIPGVNNSDRLKLREIGVQAQLYQEQEKKRKEEEIKSRMEIRPVLKRKATTAEKIRGKKDEYELRPQVVGMSGADPLLSFYIGGVGLNGVGALAKTGLWNGAKYVPTTLLGNWGRSYFVGNTFKNSSLGEPFMSGARVRIEEGYMYHTYENSYPGFVRNGVHWNMERRPGSVGIKDGKYYSNRFKTDPLNDRIWWDTNGHNDGDNVLVTKEGGFEINNPKSLAKPYGGVYYNSYRTTPRIESNKVIQFKYDPIVGYTITRNPFRQISTNKMSIRELFTPESIKPIQEPSTSLKFFERGPARISEAESLGFGKSRGFNFLSGNDLHLFYTLLDRRQTLLDAIRKLKAPKDMGVDETISKNSGSIIEDGYLMSNGYRYTPVTEKHFSTGTNMSFGRQGIGGSGHNYGLNLGGESTRVKDLGRESKITYSTPKTNLNRDDRTNLDVVITAENDKANKEGIKLLTKGMRDMESGAEFSGDASSTTAAEALSSWLRLAKNKPQLRETAMSNAKIALDNNTGISLGRHTVTDPIHGIVTENATMSPDAYSYLYRTAANNPDKFHLGYQMNAGNFNSFARNPKNAYMYDVEQNYLDGLITPQEYVRLFNSWSIPLGGRRAYFYNGRVYKPQPFLIRNKQGGKMNILEFLKNGSGIHIKKKNRGKFTSYCGGKVTDECIRKAKASGNPTLVKRATFAANARKWKHLLGGHIVVVTPEMTKNHYQGEITLGKTFKDRVFDVGNALGLFIPFIGTALDTKENQAYAAVSGGIRDIAIPGFIKWGNSKDTSKRIRGWDRRRKRNPNYGKPILPTRFMRGAAKTLGVAGLILDTPNIVSDIENLKRTLGFNYNHLLLMKEKKGGKAFVNGVNILDSNPKAYKHVKKKYLYGGPVPDWFTFINSSPIVESSRNWLQDASNYVAQQELYRLLKKQREQDKIKQLSESIGNFLSSIGNNLINLYFAPKIPTNSSTNNFTSQITPKLSWNNNLFQGGMLTTTPKNFFNQ